MELGSWGLYEDAVVMIQDGRYDHYAGSDAGGSNADGAVDAVDGDLHCIVRDRYAGSHNEGKQRCAVVDSDATGGSHEHEADIAEPLVGVEHIAVAVGDIDFVLSTLNYYYYYHCCRQVAAGGDGWAADAAGVSVAGNSIYCQCSAAAVMRFCLPNRLCHHHCAQLSDDHVDVRQVRF